MRLRLVARVVFAVTLLLPAVAAAITEKAAVKQVKAAAKTRLSLLDGALDGARVTLGADIDAFEVTVAGSGFSTAGAQQLADDLAAFQTTVEEALFRVAVDFASDAKLALATIDGAPLATIPLAFANLPGGIPEQVRAAITKRLAKTYRAVDKRLAKTSARVAANGTSTLFAVVDPPPQLAFAFTDVHADSVLFDLAIDLRLSAGAGPADGRMWVGGTTVIGDTDLVVSVIAMDGPTTIENQNVTAVGRGRFLARFGDGAPLPHTNYLLGVVPATAGGLPGASASSSFALR